MYDCKFVTSKEDDTPYQQSNSQGIDATKQQQNVIAYHRNYLFIYLKFLYHLLCIHKPHSTSPSPQCFILEKHRWYREHTKAQVLECPIRQHYYPHYLKLKREPESLKRLMQNAVKKNREKPNRQHRFGCGNQTSLSLSLSFQNLQNMLDERARRIVKPPASTLVSALFAFRSYGFLQPGQRPSPSQIVLWQKRHSLNPQGHGRKLESVMSKSS